MSDFSINLDGSPAVIASIAATGSTVELTLASAITSGQTVALTYSDPSTADDSAAVQDSAGNDAASLNNIAVTNNSTVDGNAPAFLSAATSTDGNTVLLNYNETLSSTTAAASVFTVTTDGSANAVTAVAISGSTVELTLTDTVKNEQTVTVAYSDPSGANDNNAIQDKAGNDAATLSSTAVTNNSIVGAEDTGAPTLLSAATSTDGNTVLLNYNETLSDTTAGVSDFSINLDGSPAVIASIAATGSTVELTLASAITSGQTVALTYSDPSTADDSAAVQDSAGNDAASLNNIAVTNNSTVDGNAPAFLSAATSTDGTKVLLNYNETLSDTTAGTSDFNINLDGSPAVIASIAATGSTVELTLASAITSGQTVALTYSDPSDGRRQRCCSRFSWQ